MRPIMKWHITYWSWYTCLYQNKPANYPGAYTGAPPPSLWGSWGNITPPQPTLCMYTLVIPMLWVYEERNRRHASILRLLYSHLTRPWNIWNRCSGLFRNTISPAAGLSVVPDKSYCIWCYFRKQSLEIVCMQIQKLLFNEVHSNYFYRYCQCNLAWLAWTPPLIKPYKCIGKLCFVFVMPWRWCRYFLNTVYKINSWNLHRINNELII